LQRGTLAQLKLAIDGQVKLSSQLYGGNNWVETDHMQGCQVVYFQTKNPNLGKFWRVLQWRRCWLILWPFGLFYCHFVGIYNGHVVYFVNIWVYFSHCAILYQEKSGNSDHAKVCRDQIFLGTTYVHTKTENNIPNDHKVYQMTTKYVYQVNVYNLYHMIIKIPNRHKIHDTFLFQGFP
jgi:hypothetical protein